MQPKILLADPENNREDWRRIRKELRAVGGSTVADICGDGYRTPYEAWMSITGRDEDEQIETDRLEAGRFMENGILRWWAHRSGNELLPSPGLVQHPTIPWIVGTPDALARDPSGNIIVPDAKNQDRFAKPDWDLGAPMKYQYQVQVYMEILGLDRGALAVVFGGNDLLPVPLVRNEPFLHATLEYVQAWYTKYVEGDTPPPMTGTDEEFRLWKKLHPKDSGEVKSMSAECEFSARAYRALGDEISAKEKERDAHKGVLLAEIGDATFLQSSEGWAYSAKHQTAQYKAQEARTVETRPLRFVKSVK